MIISRFFVLYIAFILLVDLANAMDEEIFPMDGDSSSQSIPTASTVEEENSGVEEPIHEGSTPITIPKRTSNGADGEDFRNTFSTAIDDGVWSGSPPKKKTPDSYRRRIWGGD